MSPELHPAVNGHDLHELVGVLREHLIAAMFDDDAVPDAAWGEELRAPLLLPQPLQLEHLAAAGRAGRARTAGASL